MCQFHKLLISTLIKHFFEIPFSHYFNETESLLCCNHLGYSNIMSFNSLHRKKTMGSLDTTQELNL